MKLKKILFILSVAFILLLTSCVNNNKAKEQEQPSIKTYAKEFADGQSDWFDYSYEIVENYDEEDITRYHITYYYTVTWNTLAFPYKLDIIVIEEDGVFKYEIVKL